MDDQLQQQLWDYVYGLLSDPETADLERRIGSEPVVARAYAEVRLEVELLGEAARVVQPLMTFSRPESDCEELCEPVSASKRTASTVSRERRPNRRLANWIVAVAASFVVAVSTLGGLKNNEPQTIAHATSATASKKLFTEVTTPGQMQIGAANSVMVRTISAKTKQPSPSHFVYRVLDDQLQTKWQSEKMLTTRDGAVLRTPPLPNDAKFIEVRAEDAPTLRVPVRVETEKYVARITADKPVYQPGEPVRLRLQALSRFHREAGKQITAKVALVDATGQSLAESELLTGDNGVAVTELTVPPTAGRYQLKVNNSKDQFKAISVPLFVRPDAKRGEFAYDLEFARDSYRPGEKLVADMRLTRNGRPNLDAKVSVTADIDGQEHRVETNRAANGEFQFRLDLPQLIEDEARLTVRVDDQGRKETLVESIPLQRSELDLLFLPEGGELVAGVPNRVFFVARDQAGQPIHVKGRIVDQDETVMATAEVSREGRGWFAFTPKGKQECKFVLDTVGGVSEYPLPRPVKNGATFLADPAIFAAGEAVRFRVATTEPGTQFLAVAECRGVAVGQARWRSSSQRNGDEIAIDLPETVGGVIRVTALTLGDDGWRPVAERLVYRREGQSLQVDVLAQEDSAAEGYFAGEVLVRNELGQPQAATLGAVATPEWLKSRQPVANPDIHAYFSLAGELSSAADVEDVNFALQPDNELAQEYLELVLGTDGWRVIVENKSLEGLAANRSAELVPEKFASPRTYDNLQQVVASASDPDSLGVDVSSLRYPAIGLCLIGLFVILLMGLLQIADAKAWTPAFTAALLIITLSLSSRPDQIGGRTTALAPTVDSAELSDDDSLDSDREIEASVEETDKVPSDALPLEADSVSTMPEKEVFERSVSEAELGAVGGRKLAKEQKADDPGLEGADGLSGGGLSAGGLGGGGNGLGANGPGGGGFGAARQGAAGQGAARRGGRGRDGETAKQPVPNKVSSSPGGKKDAAPSTPDRRRQFNNEAVVPPSAAKPSGQRADPASKKTSAAIRQEKKKVIGKQPEKGSAGGRSEAPLAKLAEGEPKSANELADAKTQVERGLSAEKPSAPPAPARAPPVPPRLAPKREGRQAKDAGKKAGGEDAKRNALARVHSPEGKNQPATESPSESKLSALQLRDFDRSHFRSSFGLDLEQSGSADEERPSVASEFSRFGLRRKQTIAVDRSSAAGFFWAPVIETDANGNATLKIARPPGAPSQRLIIDAVGRGRLGRAELIIGRRQAAGVIADLTAPAAVTAGDEMRLPLVLSNNSDEAVNVDVELLLTPGLVAATDKTQFSIQLAPRTAAFERQVLIRSVGVPQTGQQSAQLAFNLRANGDSQSILRTIRITPPGYPVDSNFNGVVDDETSWRLSIPDGVPTELSFKAFPSALSELVDVLQSKSVQPAMDFAVADAVGDLSLDYLARNRIANLDVTRAAKRLRKRRSSLAFLKPQWGQSPVDQRQGEGRRLKSQLARPGGALDESFELKVDNENELHAAQTRYRREVLDAINREAGSDEDSPRDLSSVVEAAVALGRLGDFGEDNRKAMMWIMSRRQSEGGFGSLTNTLFALQAITQNESLLYKTTGDVDLSVEVEGKTVARQPVVSTEVASFDHLEEFVRPGDNTLKLKIGKGNRAPVIGRLRTWRETPPKTGALQIATQLGELKTKRGESVEIRIAVSNAGDIDLDHVSAEIPLPGGLTVRTQRLDELMQQREIDDYQLDASRVRFSWRKLAADSQKKIVIDARVDVPGRYTSTPASIYRQDHASSRSFAPPMKIEID